MKKILLLLALILPTAVYAPGMNFAYVGREIAVQPYESLFRAVAQVETTNNPLKTTFEKGGYSVGIVQIRDCKLRDYNYATGNNYTLADCYDTEISRKVFFWHCSRFRPSDIERISRCWNGGPSGMRKAQTYRYWKKIKSKL